MTTAANDLPLPCAECGYDLRGNTGGRCPECGREFDPATLSESTIPWQRRGEVGRLRGFRRTVTLAARRPGRLAREATRPVEYRDARRFQLTCVTLAWLTIAPLVAWGGWTARGAIVGVAEANLTGGLGFGDGPTIEPAGLAPRLADAAVLAALLIGLFLWPLLASGVPSYFFHPRRLPRELQDRAVALSYYASGPLALLPVAAVLIGFGVAVGNLIEAVLGQSPPLAAYIPAFVLMILGVLLAMYAAVMLVVSPMILLARGLEATAGRVIACGVVTAVGWVVLFVVCVIAPPALVLYAQVAWHALSG